MRYIKHTIWFTGFILLVIALFILGIDRLSSWIQFIQGSFSLWAVGEYIEKRPKVKSFIHQHQHDMKQIHETHKEIIHHVKHKN